jgi:hypothetical protein
MSHPLPPLAAGNVLEKFDAMDVFDMVQRSTRDLDEMQAREVLGGIHSSIREQLGMPSHAVLPDCSIRPGNVVHLRGNGFRVWEMTETNRVGGRMWSVVSWTVADFEADVLTPMLTRGAAARPLAWKEAGV